MKTTRGNHENGDQFFTTGITDLMTSVAIIFVLLFVVALQPTPVLLSRRTRQTPIQETS